MSRILIASFFAAVSVAHTVWQPPKLDIPDSLPKASISKEMVTKLRVGTMPITLEETPLKEVEKALGGTVGSSGDASEALQWLCFHGSDANGRWVLWLESSEMSGGRVGGFAWQRIHQDAHIDGRCRTRDIQIELPIRLVIGSTESEVREVLGTPTAKYRNILIFDHEHQETIRNEPFTASNTVYVEIRGGTVWTLKVWKTTSD